MANTPRRRRLDQFELAIIATLVLNLVHLVFSALGLLQTDGSGQYKYPLSVTSSNRIGENVESGIAFIQDYGPSPIRGESDDDR